MTPSKGLLEAVRKHAREAHPNESCGVVVVQKGRRRYIPCRNVSATPKEAFEVHPEDYAAAEDKGEVVLIVHSHPDSKNAEPSLDDIQGCNAVNVPWLIVNFPGEDWRVIQPLVGTQPLVGREFIFGVQDCYSIVRDWYKQVKDIELKDFPRQDKFWERGENLYLNHLPETGFRRVYGEPQVGDVLLMQVGADLPNHGAIYLGEDIILHHMHGRLSSREIYGGYWKKHTTHIMRHESNAS